MNTLELMELAHDIVAQLEATEGEITPTVEVWLAGLEDEGPSKLEALTHVVKRLESEQAFLRVEIQRLSARKTTVGNRVDRVKAWRLQLAQELDGLGVELKTATMSFSIGSSPSLLAPDDLSKWPANWLKEARPVGDRAKAKAALMVEPVQTGPDADGFGIEHTQFLRTR